MQVSSEVLSAILEKELAGYRVIESSLGNDGLYHVNYNCHGMTRGYFINVYELAHIAKIWALGLGYEIIESKRTVRVYRNSFEVYYIQNSNQHDNFKPFDSHYVLKAAEWAWGDNFNANPVCAGGK